MQSYQKKKGSANAKPFFFTVSSAKRKPPVLPGEIESFSKNENGELQASRKRDREKINLQV